MMKALHALSWIIAYENTDFLRMEEDLCINLEQIFRVLILKSLQ